MIKGTITLSNHHDNQWLRDFSGIKSYIIYFEYDRLDYYGTHYISSQVSLDLKKESVYLGENEFYFVPKNILNTGFERTYGNFFPDHKFFSINPNLKLKDKIIQFNKNLKINEMKKRYGKEMIDNIVIYPDELIKNSEIFLIFPELVEKENTDVVIFFESTLIDAKGFMKKYFESKNIFIVDKTD